VRFFAGLAVVVAASLVALVAPVRAAAGAPAAQQLAKRYSPVLVLEPQSRPCGSGEAYRPASVDIVLGRKGVVLRGPDGAVVKEAPTAADLFGRGEGYSVDLPGSPFRPGCRYERDYRSWNGARQAVVYARVATDPLHRGKLAIEYWLFYTFNDSTGKHEGDWEKAQVDFNAATPEEALARRPYQVDLSQHAGGERSDWDDRKVAKRGTHPLVYVATGSHANYFGRALYLGRGPHEGFGCDNTSRATETVPLQTVLLPETPGSPSSPFAWLAFHGLWGQKEKGIYNGVAGPAAKEQWSHPIEWSDGLRERSVTIPGTKTLGPTLTNFFCDAVKQTGVAYNWWLVHRLPVVVLLAMIALGCVAAARRTRWRPPDPHPVRERRHGGQILRASVRLYMRTPRTFLALGAVLLPISVLAAAVQWVLFHLTGLGTFVALDGKRGAVTTLFALLIGDIGAAFATVITTAGIAVVLDEIDSRRVTAEQAVRTALGRIRPLAAAAFTQYGVVLLLTLTVVGIPLALYRFIRWSLFVQACMLDERGGRESLAESSRLVRGRWWRTFGFTALVDLLTVLTGLLVGIGLLLLTAQSLNFINLASSLVYMLTVPLAAIALTLYYFDLETRGGL
jgi:ABC-type sugar transport system permease subunit